MANAWLSHVKKTMKTMKKKGMYEKGKGLSQVIKEAKKTWKKGGADEKDKAPVIVDIPDAPIEAPPASAGKRGKKTRRQRRK